MHDHRLRREIVATQVVNNMLHGGGTTFAFRMDEETRRAGRPTSRAPTRWRARSSRCAPLWAAIEALDNRVPPSVQTEMLLEGRKLVERGTRWLLRNRRAPLDIARDGRSIFAPGAAVLYDVACRGCSTPDAEPLDAARRGARGGGRAGRRSRARVAGLRPMFAALDIVEVAGEAGLDVEGGGGPLPPRQRARAALAARPDRRAAARRPLGALARAALRDDLYGLHRALTADVLRDSRPGGDVDARVTRWVDANPAAERCLQTLTDIRVGRVFDLTTLPVAVREVRNLIQASPQAPKGSDPFSGGDSRGLTAAGSRLADACEVSCARKQKGL